MRIGLKCKRKRFVVDARVCNLFEKARGLMFRRRKKTKALLFSFKRPTREAIHSLFVFFPFVAVWLDQENRIVDIQKIKPFTLVVSPKKPFTKILEIPVNKRHDKLIKLLVGD